MVRIAARVLLAALLIGSPVFAGPPSAEDMQSAVADLASDTPAVRAEARTTILKWGDADPDAVAKALPATGQDPEATAALGEIRKELKAKSAILHRKERVLEAAGKDEALKRATLGLLDRMSDAAFLAPAEESATRLPETDGVLTPYVLGSYDEGKLGVARVMEALLVDGDLGVRRIAARILYYHGGAANEKALIAAMKDDDPYIRGGAALTLSHYGIRTAVPAIKALRKDADPQVQQHAGMALEELGAAIEPEELRTMLKSADAAIRRKAVKGFTALNDPASLDLIAPLLDDPDAGVRAAVAEAMTYVGGFRYNEEEERRKAAKAWFEEWKKNGRPKPKDAPPAPQPPPAEDGTWIDEEDPE